MVMVTATQTNRVTAMSIARVSATGADPGDTFGEDGRIFGKVNNIVLPKVMLPHADRFGPIGVERDWTRLIGITDFSFDLLQASEAPEALGPIDCYFDGFQRMTDGKVRRFRIGGKIADPGSGSYDRTVDYPRNIIAYPFLYIIGGGANWNVFTRPTTTDNNGHATGTYAALYADTRNGHYGTQARETNAPYIDHMKVIRVGFGLT